MKNVVKALFVVLSLSSAAGMQAYWGNHWGHHYDGDYVTSRGCSSCTRRKSCSSCYTRPACDSCYTYSLDNQ
jgi:hypothetical protein